MDRAIRRGMPMGFLGVGAARRTGARRSRSASDGRVMTAMKRSWSLIGLTTVTLLAVLFGLSFWLGKGEFLGGNKVALIAVEGVIVDSKEVIVQLEKHRVNP